MSDSESSAKIKFSFKEIEPNLSTFFSRFRYFYGVTNPVNFFVPDSEIRDGVDTVAKYKDLAK